MTQETFPGITRHFSKMIPTQVVGVHKSGQEVEIGRFTGGVILHGSTVVDILSKEIVASYSMKDNSWVVTKGRTARYKYIHICVLPEELQG